MKIKNKIFQFIWFKLIKPFTKRKTDKKTSYILDNYSDRFKTLLSFSNLFGGSKVIIFGDSNGEEMSDEESLKLFPELTINLSIGGTRADHWSDFFNQSDIGRKIYDQIAFKKIIINVGGNNVLQSQMELLKPSLVILKRLFPSAYFINIPNVQSELIAQLQGKKPKEVQKDLSLANNLIKHYADDRLIDIQSYSGEENGKPFFFALKDAVHFSNNFDKNIRIPLILRKVYGA